LLYELCSLWTFPALTYADCQLQPLVEPQPSQT